MAHAAPALPHGSIDLGTLLRQYQLGIVMITGHGGAAADRVARSPVQWVHGTDVADPTPFLTPRTVLLTTGTQFTGDRAVDPEQYVRRLRGAGVTALGFGVGVAWERIPQPLIDACEQQGLPLFRVPYDTPFIAIVQTTARLIDAVAHARDAWAIDAQRAVASAALQRDGIGAAVREAATRLAQWVAITDRTGRITEFAPRVERERARSEWIQEEARALIQRGVRSSRVRSRDGEQIHLQTLGRSGHLLGVLVTAEAGASDAAAQSLLGLVAALATVQLEHRTAVDSAERELRQAVVELLLAGEADLAERVSRGVLPRLPRGRVVAVRLQHLTDRLTPLTEDLRSLGAGSPGLLAAPHGEGAVLVCESGLLSSVRRVLVDHAVPAGVSARGSIDDLARLIDQAEIALGRALREEQSGGVPGPVEFQPAMQTSVLELLRAEPEARRRADALLAPLRQHDARHGDQVTRGLAAWLAHHGQLSPAAAELGLHRHTLRSRVQTAGQLLQRDLSDPSTRAELWAALELAGVTAGALVNGSQPRGTVAAPATSSSAGPAPRTLPMR